MEELRFPRQISANELGIRVLVDPEDPAVDIIAVHGLGATPSTTWTKKPQQPNTATQSGDDGQLERINWLSHNTMLPANNENVRIMVFNYDSNWYGNDAVKIRLDHVADDFRRQVLRQRKNCLTRPLVLIGHCFGGLVIEKALIKPQALKILDATIGIVLLGTPHRGTDNVTAVDLVDRIIRAGAGVYASSLMPLQANNEMVLDTVHVFATTARENGISIHCFFEQKSSEVSKMFGDKTKDFIVDEKSAKLDGCELYGLPLDHYQLNKYSDPEDGNWKQLHGVISDLCQDALLLIKRQITEKEHPPQRPRKEIDGSKGRAQGFGYYSGLDLLDQLPSVPDAQFNSFHHQTEPTCLPETRVDLLKKICDWADGQDERHIFWLNGLAGTGKSTIARTVARKYYEEKRLGASFFFSRGDGDVSHAEKFFTSIAIQLANNTPTLRQYISNTVTKDIASQSLRDQWNQLILGPLLKLDGGSLPVCYVLIVDALDECDKEEHIRIILQLLAEVRILKTVRLRIFLTSRRETPIRHGFRQIPDKEQQDFVLHDISPSIVNHDIRIFLQHSLKLIAIEQTLNAGWPGEQIVTRLVDHSSGLFIWAATACRFIRDGKRFATKRLMMISEKSSTAINAPEKHLDEIYLTVLKQSISADFIPEEVEELRNILKCLLGSIVTLFSPLSTQSLSKLLNISQEEVDQTLRDLYAILDIPKDISQPLRLHHPSFRDFLLDKKRCSDSNFQVDEKEAHQALANSCIRLMSTSLKQDICGQKNPGALVSNIQNSCIEQCLSPEVRYACLYWIQHLQKSDPQLYDNDHLYQFLQKHFLHWLEALGWIGKSSEGILAILSLESRVQANKHPNLYTFLNDAKRFALYNGSVIEQAPLQLYSSALVFAPENSIIRRQFGQYSSPLIKMKSKVQANWGAVLQTLEGHSGPVTSVAFSPDGKQIVSGSNDKTVRLWDAVTGAALQTLKGHSDQVTSVAFSPDGKQIVSGSNDQTVKLWDAVTGVVLRTFKGHLYWIMSIVFSPDGKQIVSGSWDKTVRLWDAVTSVALQTLKGHSDQVTSVAFSPDGKQIVSGSWDQTVKLWDAVTGVVLRTLKGHSDRVTSVAFSPDGKQIVSGSYNEAVRLWDAVTGVALQTLKGHSDQVTSVAFSPDGKQIISGSYDKTVWLWDAVTGVALRTLKGHSDWVTFIAFSPDGKQIVSGSYDKTVRLWDTVTNAAQTLESHSGPVIFIAFSPDGKKIVSGSRDQTVRLWDAVTGAALQTLEGHSGPVISVAFSPDGKQIVSRSKDQSVRLWDAVTGAALQTLEGYSDQVMSVAFSPDGKVKQGLYVSNHWILVGMERILWLPPEYRQTCVAVWGKVIVLGHSSGRISILELN